MGTKDWYETVRNCISNGDSPLVRIDHNKNTSIEKVNITVETYPMKAYIPHVKGYRKRLKEMISENISLKSVMEKQTYLINELEKFKHIVYKENIQPTIRMKAIFSPFSTIRKESDLDDLSQLELDEKRILLELVRYGCTVKLLMNLDFTRAFVCGGYGKEQLLMRVGDLCQTCASLEDNENFQVAVCTDLCNYEPVWTFDEVRIERQMKFQQNRNYEACDWSSSMSEIRAFNTVFDMQFDFALQNMYLIWNMLQIDSLSKYIIYCMEQWGKKNPNYWSQLI